MKLFKFKQNEDFGKEYQFIFFTLGDRSAIQISFDYSDYASFPYFQLQSGMNGLLSILLSCWRFGFCLDLFARTWNYFESVDGTLEELTQDSAHVEENVLYYGGDRGGTQIHLFVQEGCRPCMYAETQLKKVDGWEKVITITNAKENGEWSEFSKQCGIEATPTLVALIDGNVVAKIVGSQEMTTDFWKSTVEKHGNSNE